ncbi:DUF1697 domain-containing protein [Nesterenkonia sp. LB17]|uniref:DUF1697 domain-containing protein n=1 Tax=Nesterenkonia sp. LB17 TaxID=2901230 RepID=UPI001F4C6AA2|nr:DUF1697 domain-containing protein [Nesterenkonia sp. LB17]
MSRRIILVRAVNVGGTARLPMAQWRDLAESLGATEVSSHIASGNLLCNPPGPAENFDRALEAAVQTRFGFFREVISRSREEVLAALEAHPFEELDPRFSYISFLQSAPTAEAVQAAALLETGDDRWQVIDREMHLRYADGAGSPQMKEPTISRVLGVTGTARNLNTVRKLLDLSDV